MLSFHRRLFAFDHWANLAVLDAIEPALDRVPGALGRLNHVLGASRVWLGRVTGEPVPFDLQPSLGVVELRHELERVHTGWTSFLDTQTDADLSRVITYRNTDRVPLADILTHVPVHGHQHRGQINADLRAAGITPPSIDYIHATRRGLI